MRFTAHRYVAMLILNPFQVALVVSLLLHATLGQRICDILKNQVPINSLCDRPLLFNFCPNIWQGDCGKKPPTGSDGVSTEVKRPPPTTGRPAATRPPQTTTPADRECTTDACYERQIQQCCQEQGMKPECMQFCKYKLDNPNDISCHTECAEDLKRWMFCASNGQKNQACCNDKGMGDKPQCATFCDGALPSVQEMFGGLGGLTKYMPCLQAGDIIMQCHKQNAPPHKNWQIKDWGGAEPFPAATKPFADNFCKSAGK